MDGVEFFREQHQLVRRVVNGLVLSGLDDDALRRHPAGEQNSLAWLLWHAARYEDVVINTWLLGGPQVFDDGEWFDKLGTRTRHVGTGTGNAEARRLSATVDLAALRGYWAAVSDRTGEALESVDLSAHVDATRLRRAAADGAAVNELSPWLDDFFAGHPGSWFLSFLTVHNAEHLVGEALAVRGQTGVSLGL